MKRIVQMTFVKVSFVMGVFVVLLILVLYYASLETQKIVKEQINEAQKQRLGALENQLSSQMNLMEESVHQIAVDRNVRVISNAKPQTNLYDLYMANNALKERLFQYYLINGWNAEMSVYFENGYQLISRRSTALSIEYMPSEYGVWQSSEHDGRKYFTYGVKWPILNTEDAVSRYVVSVSFAEDRIVDIFKSYSSDNGSMPFLYLDGQAVMYRDGGLDGEMVDEIGRRLARDGAGQGFYTVASGQGIYHISYQFLDKLGWYLVDAVSTDIAFMPVQQSGELLYFLLVTIILTFFILSICLYQFYHKPIHQLSSVLMQVYKGNYKARLTVQSRHFAEFRDLFSKFNTMAGRIEDLIDRVGREQLIARDAKLKAMQAQINPHFLYNALAFIANMARLDRTDAVEKMALHLGAYFRYTAHFKKEGATIGEELEAVANYLEIQKLRLNRIRYTIQAPEELLEVPIPRLLLQPIVENAVIHGLEPKAEGGFIIISLYHEHEENRIRAVIQDNGIGISDERLDALNSSLANPALESSDALKNVYLRLKIRYDGFLRLERPEDGEGLRVVLLLNKCAAREIPHQSSDL